MTVKKIGVSVVVFVVVFVAVLIAAEGVARLSERKAGEPKEELTLALQPYVMSTGPSESGVTWINTLDHNKPIPSALQFNNYGYTETFDYSMAPDPAYIARYGKQPGETLVVITGGSVVYGVGATANDRTIAGRLQHYLNERAPRSKWRVVNMAMASWIAYQQFVGLSLFAEPLNPDWIVVMDGHNDGVVPCAHGSGASNPLGFPALLAMQRGAIDESRPLTRLARRSAFVRRLTGLDPRAVDRSMGATLTRDPSDPDPRFTFKMARLDFSVQDRQIDFYLQAQRDVMALFSKAHIIMSTQPVMWDNALTPLYRKAFAPGATADDLLRLEQEDDAYMSKHRTDACGAQVAPQALGYFLGKSALRLDAMMKTAGTQDRSRKLAYYNTEWSMPLEVNRRRPFFIDNAHMTDAGQDRVGEFLAEAILNAEQGRTLNLQTFIDAHVH